MFTEGTWLQIIAGEVGHVLADPDFWLAIAAAAVLLPLTLAIGGAIVALFRLVPDEAPRIDRFGVSLASGLTTVASVWATVLSGGKSAYTPVAAVIVGAALWEMIRRVTSGDIRRARPIPRRELVDARFLGYGLTALAGVFALGLMYGVTMNPSPRAGTQPIEFFDEAFYSILGRDLFPSGVENLYSPSGLGAMPGFPEQTWYHWGELWLASLLTGPFGIDALDARHFVVLPVLLIACGLLAGTLVRVGSRLRGRWPFVFGAIACLVMAPIPLGDVHFAQWARGLLFGITMYGLAAVTVMLLACRYLWIRGARTRTQIAVDGAIAASLLPSHIVLSLVLGAAVVVVAVARFVRDRGTLNWDSSTAHVAVATIGIAAVTMLWGLATGHGIGTSAMSTVVTPFNGSWFWSLGAVVLGGIPFLAIVVGWRLRRHERVADLFAVAVAASLIGAVVWGIRLGDFTAFHFFFGPLAVIVTPVAAVAIAIVWNDVRTRTVVGGYAIKWAMVLFLSLGTVATGFRLHQFGFNPDRSFPIEFLDRVEALSDNAPIAYDCRRTFELAFWNSSLNSLDAHTGHPIVPVCFQSEYFAGLTGGSIEGSTISPLFRGAPQLEVFPDRNADPDPSSVAAWLERYGVRYIYSTTDIPALVPDQPVIFEVDGHRLSELQYDENGSVE